MPHRIFSGCTRRFLVRAFLVRADVGAVQERHAECDPARLSGLEQALPYPEVAPTIEGLRRHPPRPELRWDAAPLRPVVVPPDDRLDRATQVGAASCRAGGTPQSAVPARPTARPSEQQACPCLPSTQ